MGKFDKAMGAMDDEMLDEVSGGYVPENIEDMTEAQLKGNYFIWKSQYKSVKNDPTSLQYINAVEALEALEAEMTKRGIPFDREN